MTGEVYESVRAALHEAADLNHPADVTKALAASRQAHAIVEEVMAKLIDGSDA